MARDLSLDRSIALVDVVCRYAAGEVLIDECIDVLLHAERRHDVELVTPGRNYQVIDSRIVIVDDATYSQATDPSDEETELLLRDKLFPFLTDTHAVLLPRYPDSSDVFFAGRRFFFHATARALASTHAEWARSIQWLGKRDWNYVDFLYVQGVQTLREVVDEKTRRASL